MLYSGRCYDLLQNMPDDSVDLALSSPPYCMHKDYEKGSTLENFRETHKLILPEIVRITKRGGSICWQVGYYLRKHVVTPLDFLVYEIMQSISGVSLRDRIIWTFGHGLHSNRKFSGRHETVLWFTKGDEYLFNLDAVRVRQKYPGKRSYKGKNKGKYSGNPKGKNPSNVWNIPNVKAGHVEKTPHPCQFPVALAERLILALTPPNGLVLDPFSGSGSTGVAAVIHGRRFVGAELDDTYHKIAEDRLIKAQHGEIKYRPTDRAIFEPPANSPLVQNPFSKKEMNT